MKGIILSLALLSFILSVILNVNIITTTGITKTNTEKSDEGNNENRYCNPFLIINPNNLYVSEKEDSLKSFLVLAVTSFRHQNR